MIVRKMIRYKLAESVRVSRFAHRDFTLENRPISGGFDACLSRGRFCACSRNLVGLVNQRTRRRVQQRYKICFFFLAQSFIMSFTNQSTTLFGLFLSFQMQGVLVISFFYLSWKEGILEQTDTKSCNEIHSFKFIKSDEIAVKQGSSGRYCNQFYC